MVLEQLLARGLTAQAILDFKRNDPEECDACMAIEDWCPFHEGVNFGMRMLGRALGAWFENDCEGDPFELEARTRRARRRDMRDIEDGQYASARAHERFLASVAEPAVP